MNDEGVSAPTPPSIPDSSRPALVKAHKSPLKLVVLLLVVSLLLTVAAAAKYSQSDKSAKKDVASLKSQLATLQSNAHELPAGATKVSDCIPNMGSHYLTENSDPIYGPYILVNKAGKVIGVEYMASTDMYTPIPKTDPPVELITKDSPLYGWKYDHTEFSKVPKGHQGYLKDHIDVHNYTVTSDQQKQACA